MFNTSESREQQITPGFKAKALARWNTAFNASNIGQRTIYETKPELFEQPKVTSTQEMPASSLQSQNANTTPIGDAAIHLVESSEAQAQTQETLRVDLAREDVKRALA